MFRRNVAGQHVSIAAVNATTGAALTGATISVRRCIDGTFAAATGTVTEDTGLGFYKFAMSAADTDGNNIAYFFTATNMIPVSLAVVMTSANPSDSVRFGLTGLANATPGAAGGLFIAGSNAATTVNFTGNLSGSVGSVTGLTAANLDVAVSSRMATYTQPTGFLAATFPGTVASTTNITAGTITTTTNLTNLPSIPANWITAAGVAAAALNGKGDWNVGKTGYALTATTGLGNQTSNITGNLSGSVGSVTGNVGGNVTGSVGSVVGAVGSVTGLTNSTIADQVWDEVLAGHLTAGSTGAALNAAGTAGDPWITALPGAYGAGTAGNIIGNNLNATVGSRSTQTSVDDLPTNAELAAALATADDAVLAQVALVKAKTDSLNFTVAGQVDSNVQYVNDTLVNGTGAPGNEWGP